MPKPFQWRDSSCLYRLVEKQYLEDLARYHERTNSVNTNKFVNYAPREVFPDFLKKINNHVEIIMFSRYGDYFDSNPIARKVKIPYLKTGEKKRARFASPPRSVDVIKSEKDTKKTEESTKTSSGGNKPHKSALVRPGTTPLVRRNSVHFARDLPPRSKSCPTIREQQVSCSLDATLNPEATPETTTATTSHKTENNKSPDPKESGKASTKPKHILLRRRSRLTINDSLDEIDRMVRNPFSNEVWYRKSAHILKKVDVEEEDKELTKEDIDNMIRRLCRPTASSQNRMSKRHIPEKRKKKKRVMFDTNADNGSRFCGDRDMTFYEIEDIVDRLSEIPLRVPDNCRTIPENVKSDMGILNSYRWQGVVKC
ncbi:hypothetical protein SNE40_000779 [Patella caerulea]|uniref:Uncharacterized protein n=1 Tax=Patella caerulea TaxID=87958 RepID=A0AAN8KH86_PATCE